jgi:transposase
MHVSKSAKMWRMPDELWAFVEPLLPEHENTHLYGGDRPRKDDRDAMDAIFHILRTGAQWNSLNATGICSSSTAHRRFQEWEAAGVFEELWMSGLEAYDELKGLDWSWLSMDGAMTKAPLGGGEEPAKTLRIGPSPAPSAACSPKPTACRSDWPSPGQTSMTSSSCATPSRAFRPNDPGPVCTNRKTCVWTRGMTMRKSAS